MLCDLKSTIEKQFIYHFSYSSVFFVVVFFKEIRHTLCLVANTYLAADLRLSPHSLQSCMLQFSSLVWNSDEVTPLPRFATT